MAYIKEYWNQKEKLAELARKHTAEMTKLYSKEIDQAATNTKTYSPGFTCTGQNRKRTSITVEDLDTVSAGYKYSAAGGKLALLNFSSYKEPGGMFINGSKAQEECLCHASFLYNVLVRFTDTFYAWNNQRKNKALYLNRGLYTPGVFFAQENDGFAGDVITCAAPNKSAAQKYCNVSDEENTAVLRERIRFVLDIALDNKVETLILGAYGCGVFGQDPTEVAGIFREYLNTTHKNCFRNVVFAIPAGTNGNLKAFSKVFEKETSC